MTNSNTKPASGSAKQSRRSIDRDDLLKAALCLVGPNRSVSTLGLREIAREAGIAPNSFYRHFKNTDELAVALIKQAGVSLRKIIGDARRDISVGDSVTRKSVEIFMSQLEADDQLLPLLLREGTVGSPAFKLAVDRQLQYFETELLDDLMRLEHYAEFDLPHARLAARAITRLVFTMGATALDEPADDRGQIIDDTVEMVRMIIRGAASTRSSSNSDKNAGAL